ncbi:MAG TPA: c-type cytochrome [Casimicrobiaceae bacterium]|nr:c-type cytochrome [Casimicrobiaceae bacterium]
MKLTVRLTWKRVFGALAALVLAGLALAWSGIVNIGASTGHWAITDWFLHWSMRNTVRTYAALTVQAPAIDPTGLVSAAGHFAATCATCHGAPGERPSPVMQSATPDAPDLMQTAGTWNDKELFWIIRNGIKFTPMPAWPALSREDEVRRMAAFVRRLPTMTPETYRTLAYGAGGVPAGNPQTFDDALADCERCHADDGRDQPDIPVLAGQKPAYLLEALRGFAANRRPSGVMSAAAARLDVETMRALAEHYAKLPGLDEDRDAPQATNAVKAASATEIAEAAPEQALVERIVANGLPEHDLPACAKCHAPGKRPDYPVLAGQKAGYLAARLWLWRGDPAIVEARQPNDSMAMIARRIPEHLVEPLARRYADAR